jgi:hypothetical protein
MVNKCLLLGLCLLVPALASSSPLEIARLAQLLEYASHDLASDAGRLATTGSVKHNARLLSQKAQKLQDSIERGRSSAYVRTRFTDVTRYYQRLESAIVRSMDGSRSQPLRNEFLQLAEHYENLRYQFYGDSYYQSLRSSPPSYPYPYPQRRPGGRHVPDQGAGVDLVPPAQAYERRGGFQHRAPVSTRGSGSAGQTEHRSQVLERQRQADRLRDLSVGRGSGHQADTGGQNRLEANQGFYRLRQ